MSILEKMKKAHPAYWVLGLGGVALAIDYYVERDRSVASSAYRKLTSSRGSLRQRGDTGGGGGGVLPLGSAAVMPSSIYRTTQVYYPALPPTHPHHHWMLREPFFGRGYGGRGHFGYHGREGGFGRREYGGFGRNHVR
jgi:hypothetical protein